MALRSLCLPSSYLLTDALVCTTMPSPDLSVLESSLLKFTLDWTHLYNGALDLWPGLFGEVGSVPGGFCWVAGLFGWLAAGDCWAKSG
jgi:hypothetical protein